MTVQSVANPSVNESFPGGGSSSHSSRRTPLIVVQFLGAALLIAGVMVALFSSSAGADALSNGVVTIRTASGATAANPLKAGETVNLSVSANSTLSTESRKAAGFPSGAVAIKVLECQDPGGLAANLPKKPTDCEPTTVITTAFIGSDGSMSMKGYPIYALPDVADLSSSNGTTCDTAHQCVLGIFTNQNDFTKPHLFSGPFQVVASSVANSSSAASSPAASGGGSASAGVALSPDTLAFTGGPTLWPWLVGFGAALLMIGTVLRLRLRAR